MGYRNLFLLNPSRLTIKDEQLVIETTESHRVPLEDVECIAIDNLQCTISGYTLLKLAQHRITLYISDEHHLPVGMMLPFNCHSRRRQVLDEQLAMSRPTVKQLWQELVVAKITNQAAVLRLIGDEQHNEIALMATKVKSGDSDNMEAIAAARYFRRAFGDTFTRSRDSSVNAALNYGYAILRSTIAKYLCVYGFEPSIGLFHHSTQNNFNLADDLIEPYRPIVDLYVTLNIDANDVGLLSQDKQRLLALLATDVQVDGKAYAVSYAIEKTVQSLSGIVAGRHQELLLPELLPLKQHEYE